jgi:Arm DNA-binding domain
VPQTSGDTLRHGVSVTPALPYDRLILTKALTAKRIEGAPSGSIRKEIPDGLLVGLYLVVQPSGAKSFAVRYRYAGQPRKLTLGAFPALSLPWARQLGLVCCGHRTCQLAPRV